MSDTTQDPRTKQFHSSICQYLSSVLPEAQFTALCAGLGVKPGDAPTPNVDLHALFKQHAPAPPQVPIEIIFLF